MKELKYHQQGEAHEPHRNFWLHDCHLHSLNTYHLTRFRRVVWTERGRHHLLTEAQRVSQPFEPGRFRPLYRISHKEAFSEEFVDKTAHFVKTHPLLAGTTLNVRFSGTEGFSIALTRSGMPRLQQNFPLFFEFLEKTTPDRCNAFFINPLCIAEGAHVAPHVDRSLNSWTRPELPPFPVKVSVLYLDVAEDLEGGNLLIYPPLMAFHSKPRIVPQTGLFFEFRGDLRHEVAAVVKSSRPRISLVVEHYDMPAYLLRKIPEFYVKSSREFDSFMEEALSISTV